MLFNDFTGVIEDGEMLLVLGRPGSGCSTILKAISNKKAGFADVYWQSFIRWRISPRAVEKLHNVQGV